MVNKVSFKINTSFDGPATYFIYESLDCTGTLVTSGTTNIVNGSANVVVNNIDLSEDMSIKAIDSKGCESCQAYNVEIAVCLPFSGTATYVEPVQQIYYVVDACDESQPPYTTLLTPAALNQRYILPGPNNYIYVWNGVTSFSDSIFNGSIQRISGEFGCPD